LNEVDLSQIWNDNLIVESAPLWRAIEIIEQTSCGVAIVIDSDGRFLSLLTDFALRKAVLDGANFCDPLSRVVRTREASLEFRPIDGLKSAMQFDDFGLEVFLDRAGRVIDLKELRKIASPNLNYSIVLMLGGDGKRLRPLTWNCPKPLLEVGGKPLLERTIESLVAQGCYRLFFSVNYRAEMIKEYFGDGSKWGAEIRYLHEEEMMGTAGSLRLLKSRPTDSLVVMNGDLLVGLKFKHLIEYHKTYRAHGTMSVVPYEITIPYGVVETDRERLVSIKEKPKRSSYVNAGIYVLEPDTLDLIPDHGSFDMPSLFEALLVQKFKTCVFPLREEWIDIGSIEALNEARKRFSAQPDLVALPDMDFSITDDQSANFGRIVPQIFGTHI